MAAVAISFDRISKHYRGGDAGYGALRDDIAALVRRIRPHGERARPTIPALTDVSFEIDEGASVGLIGPNGAGKTTALKVMTRITYPTGGVARVRGRVGALIEVGTGMHPELTGRENVYLYGRILGLTGRDIAQRFDQIVEFAGLGSAIDQPVKQFSSGMQLRLGFSVAAHLEPDVLLVDEAIAVGDAGFQYRCVERMRELVREGRTLVFVSHEMTAVETLCDRVILLDHGAIQQDGPARDVVRAYLERVQQQWSVQTDGEWTSSPDLELLDVTILDGDGRESDTLHPGDAMTVRVRYRANRRIERPNFTFGLADGVNLHPFALASTLMGGEVPEEVDGEGTVECRFEQLPLRARAYEVWGEVVGGAGFGDLVEWQRLQRFQVVDEMKEVSAGGVSQSMLYGPVSIPHDWSFSDGSG
jgi:ABC-type polysaccharide/polyol phosphate transport system ATPase subunit